MLLNLILLKITIILIVYKIHFSECYFAECNAAKCHLAYCHAIQCQFQLITLCWMLFCWIVCSHMLFFSLSFYWVSLWRVLFDWMWWHQLFCYSVLQPLFKLKHSFFDHPDMDNLNISDISSHISYIISTIGLLLNHRHLILIDDYRWNFWRLSWISDTYLSSKKVDSSRT